MRLTNSLKDQICRAALIHRFRADADAYIDFEAEFAVRVYDNVYLYSTREKMNALPKGWLDERGKIQCRFGKDVGEVRFDGRAQVHGLLSQVASRKDGDVTKRMLARDTGVCKVYDPQHTLAREYEGMVNHRKDLLKEIEEAKRKTMAALNASSTVKSLLEKWPDIAPFVPREERFAAPALPTSELNNMLNLGGAPA